jgi:hypothetical protein
MTRIGAGVLVVSTLLLAVSACCPIAIELPSCCRSHCTMTQSPDLPQAVIPAKQLPVAWIVLAVPAIVTAPRVAVTLLSHESPRPPLFEPINTIQLRI